MGAKSTYTEEIAGEIVDRISKGETLRAICREEGKPCWTTVYAWIKEYPTFAERIARARELGFDAIAEEALEIANTPLEGRIETDKVGQTGPYTEVRRADMLDHRKLQIETRLKLLAKWSPKKYGDKLEIEGKLDVGLVERLARARKRTTETPDDDDYDLVG